MKKTYKALEYIFTHELGSKDDYEKRFKGKEFGFSCPRYCKNETRSC